MKTIGLLAGMSWESSLAYYREINTAMNQKLGALHSAKIAMVSVDFQPIAELQHKNEWQKTAELLIKNAQSIEAAGADCLLICTNTMHKVAHEIEQAIDIPLLHIADATAEALLQKDFKKVGLLGTAFTMQQDFYKGRLSENFNIEAIVPNEADQKIVHDIIYQELCHGKINQKSKEAYVKIIKKLQTKGVKAVILGCTEIAMLIKPHDVDIPLFDTTKIHAQKAVEWATKK